MPMSHASLSLSTINTSNASDPAVPSSNLRSYVALPRPGMNANNRVIKSVDEANPMSRTELSVLSGKNVLDS